MVSKIATYIGGTGRPGCFIKDSDGRWYNYTEFAGQVLTFTDVTPAGETSGYHLQGSGFYVTLALDGHAYQSQFDNDLGRLLYPIYWDKN